jgi:putative endonuclease
VFFVYILYSAHYDKFYIGQTKDIRLRVLHHNAGVDFTRKYLPWELFGYVVKESRSEAILLEKKLKNLSKSRLREFVIKYGQNN